MYGYQYKYSELLKKSGFKTLANRRESAALKFAQKASENPIYKDFVLSERKTR